MSKTNPHRFKILDLIYVLYLRLIIFSVGGDVPIDSEALLVTDFVNLKINPTQSFEGAHRGECSYVYKYLCLYRISKKKTCLVHCTLSEVN
jgi:hypothetical protein